MLTPSVFRLPSPSAVPAADVPPVAEPPAPAAAPGCDLWLVDGEREADTALALAPAVLDGAEQKRAAAFHRERDRRIYTAAHVALRMILGARLNVPARAVELVRETCPTCGGPHGRPAVAGGTGLHFSLSHSGTLALIGLADRVIGVDVEQTPALDTVDRTADTLHPDETAELAALPDDTRPVGFGRAWTRKEAYLKALGTGLSRSPALDYMGTGPVPAQRLPRWTLTDVAVPEGYLAATVVRR